MTTYTLVAKAAPRQIGSPPIGEVGPDIGPGAPRARARRSGGEKVYRISDMGSRRPSAGAGREFLRGAKGGARSTAFKASRYPVYDKVQRRVYRGMESAAESAHAMGSAHPQAFRAGVKSGKVGVLLGAGGAVVGGSELKRYQYNRHGANLAFGENIAHPIRASHKRVGSRAIRAYKQTDKAATKAEARAANAPAGSIRNRYQTHFATNLRSASNRYAYTATRADKDARGKLTGRYDKSKTYTPPSKIGKSALDRVLAKAALPGDNRDAEMARSRRKAGLGVAGGGYLMQSRAKEISPGVADWLTPKAEKVGGVKARKKLMGVKAKKISRVAGKGGAVVTGAGLALAAEGAVNDLRYRNAVTHTRQQAKQARARRQRERRMTPAIGAPAPAGITAGDPFGKAYQYGAITQHHEQAGMHARKKTAADRRMKAGAAAIPAGLALVAATKLHGHKLVRLLAPAGRTGDEVADRVKMARRVAIGGVGGGLAIAGGGAGTVAEGAISRTVHGHKQNKETKLAQQARQSRNASVKKVDARRPLNLVERAEQARKHFKAVTRPPEPAHEAAEKLAQERQKAYFADRALKKVLEKAFDSERQRHNRQAAYTGAAGGAAVLATGGGVAAGLKGRKLSGLSRDEAASESRVRGRAQAALGRMANGTSPLTPDNVAAAANLHEKGARHATAASQLAGKAKKFKRVSRGSLGAAAALAAAGYGVHDYDRRRGGRSYGF